MTRQWSTVVMVVLFGAGAWLMLGQSAANAELQTMVDGTDRYQIMQSARTTLRIDRFTGETDELSERNGRQFWRSLAWHDAMPNKAVAANRVNFQAATQGPLGQTYLWEIATGRTWHLATDKDTMRWQLVDEE